MAIKADADSIIVEKIENGKRYVQVSLKADTSAEVVANGVSAANVENLLPTDELVWGSTALCSDLSFGFLKSSKAWQF